VDEIPPADLEALLTGKPNPDGMEMRWCAYKPHLVTLAVRGQSRRNGGCAGSFAGMRRSASSCRGRERGTRLSMLGEEIPKAAGTRRHALREAQVDETWPKWVACQAVAVRLTHAR